MIAERVSGPLLVAGNSEPLGTRYWTMGANGIYFVPAGNPPRLHFWDFAMRRVRELISFPRPPVASLPGLAVSPDGRWVLYSQVDEDNADIMLLENFR